MRIAFFTDTFLPQINGVATCIANEARELGRRGHDVLIVTPKPKKGTEKAFKAPRVHIVQLTSMPSFVYPDFRISMFALRKVLAALREFDPDFIHLHTPITVGLHAIVAAKMLHKPLAATNHVFITKENADFLRSINGNALVLKALSSASLASARAIFDAADLRLTPSKMLIRDFRKDGYKRSIIHLPNPVAIAHSASEKLRADVRDAYGLEGKVILHFGRLSPEKSIDVLLRAFAVLKKSQVSGCLLIVGDGPARSALESLARRLKVEDSVIFAGAIDHDALMQSGILAAADLFVTASKSENQPMAVLEAMAFGLPVVAVKEAGMIDLVDGAGVLIKADDPRAMAEAMEKVLHSPALAKKLSAHALKRANEHSVAKHVDRLEELYADARRRFEKSRKPDSLSLKAGRAIMEGWETLTSNNG